MTSRKAANGDIRDERERPNKRPRLEQDAVAEPGDNGVVGPSLDHLNGDCLLHVLSYLPTEDLDSIAVCNRHYQRARAHESLDQARTGTIAISQGSTMLSLFDTIERIEWNEVFQGNRTNLKIAGLENLELCNSVAYRILSFDGVTSLRLVGRLNDTPYNRPVDYKPIFRACPNLRKVDLSSLEMTQSSSAWDLCVGLAQFCSNLNSITWQGCQVRQHVSGCSLRRARNLTELTLDGCRFLSTRMMHMNGLPYDYVSDGEENYMFRYCQHLARLSIKNATYKNVEDGHFHQPIPQEMLISMVRRHPTLRWLCSDLTNENMKMLQRERPEVTLVN